MVPLATFVALLTLGAPAAAQSQTQVPRVAPPAQEPIDPDRPDVTNGTHIVDVGLLQVEFGGQVSRGDDSHDVGTPITLRLGLTDWLEARLGGDGFLWSSNGGQTESGLGNIQVAAKLRLWADPGGVPVLSILPSINLPVASASKGLGSGQSDFTITALTGTDFAHRGHVDVNYGIGRIGAGAGLPRFTQHLLSLSASVEIPGPVTPYAEFFWYSRQDANGGRINAIDSGAIYVITPRLALDGGMQVGLSADAPAWSAFAGISLVVGNVLGNHGVHARQRQGARRAAARAGTHHR